MKMQKILVILCSFFLVLVGQYTSEAKPTFVKETTEQLQSILGGALRPLREQYDALPPKGKFGTGIFVGFTFSKVAVRSTVKVAKIAGSAFVL